MKNRIVILVVLFTNILIFGGCFDGRQTRYHENVAEIEEYILDELGDYIRFSKPLVDEDLSVEEGLRVDRITWNVEFLRDYYYDDDNEKRIEPGQVIARFIEKYNGFMNAHPDYYLSNDYVCVQFNIPTKTVNDYEVPPIVFSFYSWPFGDYSENRGILIGASSGYDEYWPCDNCWPYLYDQCDLEYAGMTHDSIDQVMYVVNNMPNIKKVMVRDKYVAEADSILVPESVFVSATDSDTLDHIYHPKGSFSEYSKEYVYLWIRKYELFSDINYITASIDNKKRLLGEMITTISDNEYGWTDNSVIDRSSIIIDDDTVKYRIDDGGDAYEIWRFESDRILYYYCASESEAMNYEAEVVPLIYEPR